MRGRSAAATSSRPASRKDGRSPDRPEPPCPGAATRPATSCQRRCRRIPAASRAELRERAPGSARHPRPRSPDHHGHGLLARAPARPAGGAVRPGGNPRSVQRQARQNLTADLPRARAHQARWATLAATHPAEPYALHAAEESVPQCEPFTRRRRSERATSGSPPRKLHASAEIILATYSAAFPLRSPEDPSSPGALRCGGYLELEPDPPSQVCTQAGVSRPVSIDLSYVYAALSYPVKEILNKDRTSAILPLVIAKKLRAPRDYRKLDHFRAESVNSSRP